MCEAGSNNAHTFLNSGVKRERVSGWGHPYRMGNGGGIIQIVLGGDESVGKPLRIANVFADGALAEIIPAVKKARYERDMRRQAVISRPLHDGVDPLQFAGHLLRDQGLI